MFQTPILFLVFNRPRTTQMVFEAIRQAKPRQLYIAADGPRKDREGEAEKCQLTRQIATQVDWECEVHTLFREENLGTRHAIHQAIDWFFSQVEEGIILEDDCLPSNSFFTFSEQMLAEHRNNDKIMHIGGNSYIDLNGYHPNASYYFSNYAVTWGWATWRRAWQYYDGNLKEYNLSFLLGPMRKVCQSAEEFIFWRNKFHSIIVGQLKTCWDYQWIFTLWAKQGLAITSSVNLVSNIGIGPDATHTFESDWKYANMPSKELDQIIHPEKIEVDRVADRIFFEECGGNYMPSWYMYVYYGFKNRLKPIIQKLRGQLPVLAHH